MHLGVCAAPICFGVVAVYCDEWCVVVIYPRHDRVIKSFGDRDDF